MARNDRGYQPEKKEFIEQVVSIDRVSRVVKGGRRFRFRALVVIGDGKNRIGVGVSKGSDVQSAISKAVEVAKKEMITIATYKTTIPHRSEHKLSGANILLMPARPGTGIIAGGTVRAVLDVTGIQDILSKSLGSSNKVNVAYATLEALKALVPADQWVTNRGKSKTTKKKEEVEIVEVEAVVDDDGKVEEAVVKEEIVEKKPAAKKTAAKKTPKKTAKAGAK